VELQFAFRQTASLFNLLLLLYYFVFRAGTAIAEPETQRTHKKNGESNMSSNMSAAPRAGSGASDHVEAAPAIPVEINQKPSISVIGLGYVGAVSVACFANLGFRMIGADVVPAKVEAIQSGRSPIVEEGLETLLRDGVSRGLIEATTNVVDAVKRSDITFLSVGTPTAPDGGCDTTYVRAAAKAIGEAIRDKDGYHLVVMRCSVPPGTTMGVVVPEVEAASGKSLNLHFGVCFNPEFLREGVAVADFYAPPKTVIGATDVRAAAQLSAVYRMIDEKILLCSITGAEMVKYIDNVWHAAKVTFANEVGRLCKAVEVDSHEVMNIFVQDLKLNLSPYYLKPGFAFGGSCLPKEVRAIEHLSQAYQIRTPLFDSLMESNNLQIEEALKLIRGFPGQRIGFLGVAFKCDTDDLRESPTLELMAALMADGAEFSAFDPNLKASSGARSHFEYMKHARPHLAALMEQLPAILRPTIDSVVNESDVLVVSHSRDEYRDAVRKRPKGVHVIDLVRLFKQLPDDPAYHGISW
jgi:GDP-mannose 6-dehydrogenase